MAYLVRRSGCPILDALSEVQINWWVESAKDSPVVLLGIDMKAASGSIDFCGAMILDKMRKVVAYMDAVQEVADDD